MAPFRKVASTRGAFALGFLTWSLAAQDPRPTVPGPQAPGAPTPPTRPQAPPPPESWAAESRPVRLSGTPAQVRVYAAEDILRSGARTLGEFLVREMPGQIQNEGGPGLPSRSFLGGLRPQDTVVLFDGIPVSDPGRLGTDLNEIPLVGVTRIEVITGSPGMGFSGAGGTIALYTGKPKEEGPSGDLSGLGGANGRGSATVAPGYGWEDGYLRGGSFTAEEKQTTDTTRPYRQVSNFFAFGQKVDDVTWTLGWRHTAFGVPTPFQDVTESTRVYNPSRESRQQGDSGLLRLDFALSEVSSFETTFSMSRFRHEAPDEGLATPQRFEGRDARLQLAYHRQVTPRIGLSLRTDYGETRQDGTEDPDVTGRARQRTYGLGLEWRFDVRPTLRIIGQARNAWFKQTALRPDGSDADILNGSGAMFRLGANQELPWGFRLYAGAGTGTLPPHLIQQLRNLAIPGATPLKAEKLTFSQIGLGWGTGRAYGKLEAQQLSLTDAIGIEAQATTTGPRMIPGLSAANVAGGTAYVNQDRIRLRGVEGTLGWSPLKHFGLEAFARAQEARDLNAAPGQEFSTPAVQRRPFSTHGLKTRIGADAVRVDVHYTLVGHQFASIGDCDCAAPVPTIRPIKAVFRDVGMTTTVKAGKHWTLIWRGEHLLQPKVDPAEWVARLKDSQNDTFMVYGYPAARPSYSFEARFTY